MPDCPKIRSSQIYLLLANILYSEMLICLARNTTAARCACEKAFLQQIGLVDVFNRDRVLIYSGPPL